MRIPGQGVDSIVAGARARLLGVEKAVDLPEHGVRWQAYVDRMRESISKLNTPDEVLRFAQASVGFEHRGNIHHEGKFTALYERELYVEFPQFAGQVDKFADIPGSAPDTTYEHKGRLISNVLFYLARIVLRCLTHVPNPNTILEIGGGYGAPARLWLCNPIHAPQRYIILDIPESLFFADVFLRREFGEASVHYVEKGDLPDSAAVEGRKVILCPLSRHEVLQGFAVDLVVNTGSMQEMSEAWVNFYSEFLDRLRCRWFYSLNYFAQPISYLAESANLWSPRVSSRWIARTLRWNPAFVRMQADRNYLEAIYEKSEEPAPTEGQIYELAHSMEARFLTGELFVEYMELVRRTFAPELMLAVIRRVMDEMPFHPKEVAYLVDSLLSSKGAVAERNVEELRRYQAVLLGERQAGTEAIY